MDKCPTYENNGYIDARQKKKKGQVSEEIKQWVHRCPPGKDSLIFFMIRENDVYKRMKK